MKPTDVQADRTVRVWDLPTRLFHWLLALAVIALIVTGQIGGNAIEWHARMGVAVGALLVFRLAWGLVGGRWSRFASFLYGPATLLRYLRGQSPETAHPGHNPLGALSVFALLGVLAAQVGSGLVIDDEIAFTGPLYRFVESSTAALAASWHREWGTTLLFGLLGLHIVAILFHAHVKKNNLVRPMITGDKVLPADTPASRDGPANRLAALLLAAACAGLAWWVWQLGATAVPSF